MSPIAVGLVGFVVLFALLLVGLPVGVGLALVGFAGLWYLISPAAAMVKLATVPFDTVCNFNFSALPLFIFMAQVGFTSGLSKDLYALAAKWLGRLPGGIAMATVGGCAGFAAISASSVATAVTMGTVALPEMKRYKYDPALATGSVTAGGALGILIPPSGVFLLYGILTETSIGKLFIAGVIPGVILAAFYMITIYILCKLNPALGPRGPSYTLKEKIMAFGGVGEVLGLIALVLGGLLLGWFTATEAGAVGAFGAIALSMIRKRLDWEKFKHAVIETLKTTGMIYAILIGAFIFTPFIAASQIPMWLSAFITGLGVSPMVIMLIIIATYIILGTAMEENTMLFTTLPLFFPLILSLGFDPIWFGVIVVRMMMIAMISPPVGINLFVIQGISKEPMTTIFKGVIPFLIADVFHVILLLFVPQIATFLPSFMRY